MQRRCLVLADGFYEWRQPDDAEAVAHTRKGGKIPYWIFLARRRPFAFAGLWEKWQRGGESLFTCTILTTRSNALVAPIHDRMPVILGCPEDWNPWVNPRIPSSEMVDRLSPYPAEEMATYPVSTYVNDPVNEGPACIAAAPGGTLA
jgi:putative SOS response-associated peptidase YedK